MPENNARRDEPERAGSTFREVTVVTVHNPGDVIPLIPHFFGYQIADSFIALGLDRDTGVVTRGVRTDLPAEDEPVTGFVTHLVQTLRNIAGDGEIEAFLLFGFGPESRVTRLMDGLLEAASYEAIPVNDAVRVEDGRYWVYGCTPEDGCPAEGYAFTADGAGAAALHLLGDPALPTRDEFTRQLQPQTGLPRLEMEAATDDARRWRATLSATAPTGRALLRTAAARYQAGGRLTAQEAARLSVLLDDVEVRDYAYRWIDPDRAQAYGDLWTDMARRAVDNVAICLVLAAISVYLRGEGTLAGAAIDEALAIDPGHPLARLVGEQLAVGTLPPREVWQRLYREADAAYGDETEEPE